MPLPKAHQQKTKTEDELLDQATQQLLLAVKKHAADQGKKLTRDQLSKEGYSERFIDKVEKA